jgi:hypothetical protein
VFDAVIAATVLYLVMARCCRGWDIKNKILLTILAVILYILLQVAIALS